MRLSINPDGSRNETTYGAGGQVLTASATRSDGTLVSAATYGAGGVQTSAVTLNADGSHTVLGFDAAGHVQRVSFTHDDGSGASFVVEAGGSITAGQAVLNQVSVSLAEQILAQPADDKHTVSQKVTLPDGELHNVTMDASGKIVAKHEHPNALLGDIEEGVGILADVLTLVPGLNGVGIGLAIGLGFVEGGQELASGNVLGGVLSIAGAAAGADGAPNAGRLVAVAQGVSGVITGAESGDIGTAVASGLGGLGAVVSVFDPGLGKLLLASSALTSVGVAASGGNVLAALGPAITALANGADAADQLTSDPNADNPFAGPGTANTGGAPPPGDDPGTAGGSGTTPGGDTSAADPFAGPGVDGTAAAAALAADTASIAKAAQNAAASTAAQAGGGTGASGGGAATGGSGAAGTGGGAPSGAGSLGARAGYAPDGSQQSGGLPTTNGGTDTSGTVHVYIDPVKTGYVPTGDSSTTPGSGENAVSGLPPAGATSSSSTVFSPSKEGYHFYHTGPNLVAPASLHVTATEMADEMSRFAVPGQSPDQPVQSGQRYPVYAPITGTFVGNVTTTVSPDGLTTINETSPGHLLYDGQVTRSAIESPDGSWSITTIGIGNNIYTGMADANELFGPDIFNNIDEKMRQNILIHHGAQ